MKDRGAGTKVSLGKEGDGGRREDGGNNWQGCMKGAVIGGGG